MKKNYFILNFLLLFAFTCLAQNNLKPVYKYRKYSHVKALYQRLAVPVTEICVQHRVPPAAVLSILSLESGWGQGYIGKITGNFLSLNAVRKEAELPALKMPKNIKTQRFIISKKKLANTPKTNIVWQMRPASLKKDYRPKAMAGTVKDLDYFINHPKALTEANLKNITDFVTRFISYNSRIKAYNNARKLLDEEITKNGVDVLFDEKLNIQFINTIGGKPNSFNFRTTWPKKVIHILKNIGATELTKSLYLKKQSFNEAW